MCVKWCNGEEVSRKGKVESVLDSLSLLPSTFNNKARSEWHLGYGRPSLVTDLRSLLSLPFPLSNILTYCESVHDGDNMQHVLIHAMTESNLTIF